MKADNISYGFTDFKNNKWCNSWVDAYNNLNQIIRSINPNNKQKLEFYLNQRHQLFVSFMELSKNKKVE